MAAHFLFLTWFFLTDVYFARHEVDDSPMESVDKTDEVNTSELAPGSLFDSGAGTCLFFFFWRGLYVMGVPDRRPSSH